MIALFALTAMNLTYSKLPDLPNPHGLAGCQAGVSHRELLVAGGANFPIKPPWEGGQKVWYRTVYGLSSPHSQWKIVGRLPHNLAYGVSVSYENRMILAGGSDANRHYADVFSVEYRQGHLAITRLPSLPVPVANGCGALVGHTLYVEGGQTSPTSLALKSVFALNLRTAHPHWKSITGFPGAGRILATAVAYRGSFWVVGGASLHKDSSGNVQRTYLNDGYRYTPGRGWTHIENMPYPEVAAPSPAPTSQRGFFVLGGDDGSSANIPMAQRHGFPRSVLFFDFRTGKWEKQADMPVGRVTTPTAFWRGLWVYPNGEKRAGVRSPEVWTVRLE